MSETKEIKVVRRSVALALGVVCALLIAGLGAALTYYTATINNVQKQLNDLLTTTTDSTLYYDLYHDEFGNVSFRNPNYNFSPPVSMYHALWIALKSEGWNASSLSGETVVASLQYADFSQNGGEVLHEVTQPAENYLPVQVNDTTYRYVWTISVGMFVRSSVLRYCDVDAATAEIVEQGAFAP